MLGISLLVFSILIYVSTIVYLSAWRIVWILTLWFIGFLFFVIGMHNVYEGLGRKVTKKFENMYRERLVNYIGYYIFILFLFFIAYPFVIGIISLILALIFYAYIGVWLELGWIIFLPYTYWYLTALIAFLMSFLFIPFNDLHKDLKSNYDILDSVEKHHKSPKFSTKIAKLKKHEEDIDEEIERPDDITNGVYLTDQNWPNFYNFIANTRKTLDILTNVITVKAILETLEPLKNQSIRVRILTRRIRKEEKEKLREFESENRINIEIHRCPKLHAKVYIRDDSSVIVGSPNYSHTSLGSEERGGYFEAYYKTDDLAIVKSTRSLFDSIYKGKDLLIENPRFLTSKKGPNGIPSKIIRLVKNEKRGITVLMSSGLVEWEMLNSFIDFNRKVNYKLVIDWPKEATSLVKDNLANVINISEQNPNIKLATKRRSIHAKLYVFEGQKKAFVSSMNLTRGSWIHVLEAGVLLDDKEELSEIMDSINSLEDKEIEDIITKEDEMSEESGKDFEYLVSTPSESKLIPFELDGERWKGFFYNQIKKFRKLIKLKIGTQKVRAFGARRKRGSPENKDYEIRTKAGLSPQEAGMGVCKICKENPVVNFPGMRICKSCKRKHPNIKDESFIY